MIRISSLIWTLILSLIVTGISFFYIRGETRGFPFSFSKEIGEGGFAESGFEVSSWSLVFDIVFWWFLFSIVWIILKNYVFDM
jgi:ribose/xylose/arabinose/galactoside ABC-type transport system permease subunit